MLTASARRKSRKVKGMVEPKARAEEGERAASRGEGGDVSGRERSRRSARSTSNEESERAGRP